MKQSRRRKKADEADPLWWEALHKSQDWDEQGLSHRKIADRLNREGYKQSKHLWTDMAVTRALDKHPKYPVEYPVKWPDEKDWEDPNSYIEVTRFEDDGTPKDRKKEIGTAHLPGDFPGDTPEEQQAAYEAFKREVARQAYVPLDWRTEPKRAYPELKPRDWTTESSSMWAGEYKGTWTAGQEGWDKAIVPMVAEQSRTLGWGFLDRLDQLQGDPVDKAKLRWAYLGMIRRLCMREETVLALKAQVAELRAKIER